jgi:hypothetical protein
LPTLAKSKTLSKNMSKKGLEAWFKLVEHLPSSHEALKKKLSVFLIFLEPQDLSKKKQKNN